MSLNNSCEIFNYKSNKTVVKIGIPQGSITIRILGLFQLILFSLFINDLAWNIGDNNGDSFLC